MAVDRSYPSTDARPIDGGPFELRRLARHGGIAALGSVVGTLAGLVLTLVVTHGLPKEAAGRFFTFTAIFIVLQTLLSGGVNAGLARFVPAYRARNRVPDLPALLYVAVAPIVVASTCASALIIVFAAPLGNAVDSAHAAAMTEAFRLIGLVLVPTTLEVAALEGARAFGALQHYVAVQLVGVPVLRPVFVAAGVAFGLPLWGLLLFWLVPLLLALVDGGVHVLTTLRREVCEPAGTGPRRGRRDVAREYWRFAGARGAAMVFDVGLKWFDVILVAAIVSAAQAAVYAAASRFITAGTVVAEAARVTLSTELSDAFARNQLDRVALLYRTATQWVVLLTWPLYLMGAAFAATVLAIFGSGYERGAAAMAVLCAAFMVNVAAGGVQTVLLMGGKSSWLLVDKAGCFVLDVLLNLVLVPEFGILGAAIAWAVTIVVDMVVEYLQVRLGLAVVTDIGDVLKACAAPLVVVGVAGLVAVSIAGSSLPVLVITLGVVAVLYPVVLWRFRSAVGLVLRVYDLPGRADGQEADGALNG